MTLLEMKKLALAQMGEDTGDAELVEFGSLLNAYINEAYMQVCRHKKQKLAEEMVNFANGKAQLADLEKQATVILSISDEGETKVSFDVQADFIFIPDGAEGDFLVQYLYLPEKLTEDDDKPDLAENDCVLLCDFATYRMLSLGNPTRQKRAEFFLMRYLTGYSDQKAKQTHLVNKY